MLVAKLLFTIELTIVRDMSRNKQNVAIKSVHLNAIIPTVAGPLKVIGKSPKNLSKRRKGAAAE